MMRDSTQKYITVGVLAAALLVTVTLAGGFVGSAAAQTAPTVEESTVDADGSQITVRTGGSASVAVANLPAGSSVSDVSDGGFYNENDASILWSSFSGGLPETVTFTLTPPEERDTVQFTLSPNDNTVILDVNDELIEAELPEAETLPPSIVSGDTITQEVVVTNNGDQAATETVSLSIQDANGNTVAEDSVTVENLAAGASQSQTLALQADATPGEYTFVLAAGGTQQLSQSLTITDPANTAAITGDVRDLGGELPSNVEEIDIRVFQDGNEIEESPVNPDSNGVYVIEVTPEDGGSTYSLQVNNPRFTAFSRQVTVQPQSTERIDIGVQTEREPRDIALDVTVADDTGTQVKSTDVPDGTVREIQVEATSGVIGQPVSAFDPVAGQTVTLELTNEVAGELVNADDDGELQVETNENGIATAEFEAVVYDTVTTNVTATTQNAQGDIYETDSDPAVGQGVNDDSNQAEINVFTTGTLTGDVLDRNQDPIPGATVTLQRQTDDGDYEDIGTDTPPASGQYVFPDLSTQQNYRVIAEFGGDSGSATIANLRAGTNTRDLVVQGSNQEDPTGSLTGDVIDQNEDPISGADVTIQRETDDGDYEDIGTDTTTPSGQYVFQDLSIQQNYRVIAEFGGDSGSAAIVNLRAGTNTRDVVVQGSNQDDPPSEPARQVAPDGEITVTRTPEDTSNTLGIQGETAGWTVVDTNPEGLTVNPQPGTVLDPAGGEDDTISTFGSYDNGEFSVTLSPPSDASVGESYQFDVTETRDGETVNSDSFTIGIGSSSSAPSWVGNSDTTPAQYNAFDDGDGELTDSEVRDGIQTYVQSSLDGENQINGVEFTDSEIRELITGYVQSQL